MGDVLNNFDPDTLEANAARTLLAITMFFTYPMEAFVARHVLVQMFYDGDMDGHNMALSPDGTTLSTATMAAGQRQCFGLLPPISRRHKITWAIYIATLLPALVVDDLGPVLSITGSLGGSCLSYIGPGLVYLGVNGDAFLLYVAGILDRYQARSSSVPPATGDLPLEGDAQVTMQVATPSNIAAAVEKIATGGKPWWWYLSGMHLWVSIALIGSDGMQDRLSALELEHGTPKDDDGATTAAGVDETIGPCRQDYAISMFFVSFGILAAVVGLVSNIYVQINQV